MILSCPTCRSDTDGARFQDATYGTRQRVANPTKKPDEFRCTICRAMLKATVAATAEDKATKKRDAKKAKKQAKAAKKGERR